jgi:regulator of protease activity HflC (stomatin/prohibitin superfamily)
MPFIVTFFLLFILEPLFFSVLRFLNLYMVVQERECRVFVLFGKVLGIIDEPGLHFPILTVNPLVILVNVLGTCHRVDLRIDQQYLRSQPVNSEEGAPMGIGIWYEMWVSDPIAYLFKNTDPRGSLGANVSSATIRCLSNLPLSELLENRHTMSQTVREEVSTQSVGWGYNIGSIYIRKVHFRDIEMIRQIEEKVVNRLRQVTSAIRQAGANQVNLITSSAEKEAAAEFARASAMRPEILGAALRTISRDSEVATALFEVLETQKLIESNAQVTLVPERSELMSNLIASN